MEGSTKHIVSIFLFFSGLFAVLVSCNGQKKSMMNQTNEVANPLTLVVQDNYATTDTEETLVIKNEKSLRAFFAKINRTRKPGIPVPEVDFTKDFILVYCSGKQQGGAVATLSMIAETEETIVLGKEEVFQKDKGSSPAVVSPFSVYKMPLTKKEITFKELE